MSAGEGDSAVREFERLAPDYDRRWSAYIEATLRETERRLQLRPGESLLDVGCGTGALLETLAKSVPSARLTGCDPSPGMLRVARQRLGAAVILEECRSEALPFRDQQFDVVVSTNAFHYFRDPPAALGEMARVLRPAGRLVMTDWCDDYLGCKVCDLWLRIFDRGHFRAYGEQECRHFLEQAGFGDVRIDRYKISWLWGLMTATARGPSAQDALRAARTFPRVSGSLSHPGEQS